MKRLLFGGCGSAFAVLLCASDDDGDAIGCPHRWSTRFCPAKPHRWLAGQSLRLGRGDMSHFHTVDRPGLTKVCWSGASANVQFVPLKCPLHGIMFYLFQAFSANPSRSIDRQTAIHRIRCSIIWCDHMWPILWSYSIPEPTRRCYITCIRIISASCNDKLIWQVCMFWGLSLPTRLTGSWPSWEFLAAPMAGTNGTAAGGSFDASWHWRSRLASVVLGRIYIYIYISYNNLIICSCYLIINPLNL